MFSLFFSLSFLCRHLLSSAAKFSIACFHKSKDLLTTYDDDDDDNDDDDGDDDDE